MDIKNRNLFRISRFFLLKLPSLFRFFARFHVPQKRVLIIKTDAIGDYVLFRNFIEAVKNSKKFKDYRIDLLGNPLWQDLALKYDAGFVGNFYFIKQDKLYESPLKLLKIGWQLFRNSYEVVLQPSSTRLLVTDGLAALTAAKEVVGFEGNTDGILSKYKVKTDKFYTRRLLLPATVHFEFERSKFFFENALDGQLNINSIDLPAAKNTNGGIVIFPGAGVAYRAWRKENFGALIDLIKQHTTRQIYLAGGPGDVSTGQYLEASTPAGSVVNLVGKTSLTELADLIAGSALVIANETSAIHIAVAAKTTSVCLLGGGHFERFAPYPSYFAHAPVCIYYKMDCYYCNWNCIYKTAENEPNPCIDNIGIADVWEAVLPLLPE